MQEDTEMLVNRRASTMMLNFIALLSLVGLFAACGGSGGTTGSSNASSLTLWTRDSDAALVQTIAKAYNSSHTTQIKPNIIPAGQFVSKFGTAVASGDVPDLVATDLVCPSAQRVPSSCTIKGCSARQASILTSHPPLGQRSRRMPRRSRPWAMASMATTSLGPAPGA